MYCSWFRMWFVACCFPSTCGELFSSSQMSRAMLLRASMSSGSDANQSGVIHTCAPAANVIKDGWNSFLCPPRDVHALVRCRDRVAANPALRTELSRNACQTGSRLTLRAGVVRSLEAIREVTRQSSLLPARNWDSRLEGAVRESGHVSSPGIPESGTGHQPMEVQLRQRGDAGCS